MKEKRINYLVDRFIDEFGDERHFVLCAVSYEFDKKNEQIETLLWKKINDNTYEDEWLMDSTKGLKFGYAICRPKYTDKDGVTHEDKFDPEFGKQIALGRARMNGTFALLSDYAGDINTDVVEAFLKRRAKYFKNNPEMFIKGYSRKK